MIHTPNITAGAPVVSVVVPLYNKAPWVGECLDSLVAQSLLDSDANTLEILVVDDGSTDGGPAIVADYAARHPSIRVVRQENAGPSVARNRGVAEAAGEWVGFVDADDTVSPAMYRHLLDVATTNDCKVARCQLVRSYGDPLATPDDVGAAYVETASGAELYRRLFGGPDISLMTACTAIYQRSLLVGHGITFDEQLRHTEDALLNAEVYSLDTKVAVSSAALYRYRPTANSLGQAYDPDLFKSADRLRERLTLFELEPGTRGDGARAGSAALRRYLGLYYTIALADEVAAKLPAATPISDRLARIVRESEMAATMDELRSLGELGPFSTVWLLARTGRWRALAVALRAFNVARTIRRG